MKKNFFKKLSFVMALAMIVTALAPAAGVFAAAAPKLNAKTVYLHVAEKTTEFDFNVANKKSGWKYAWKSSNENVAEVASNGLVTAVGVGTATVSVVIKDKKGEKVDTLKATVTVRDNIKKLTVKNPVAGDKLAVGAKYDFNRNYVTASGSKTKTSGITRWAVDKTGATIEATSGKFVANEAGTYTITARAFQSTSKYNSWLADSKKYASYVTATVSYTVKVAADTVKAAQTTLSKVDLTFDSAMTDDVKSKISVYKISGTTEISAAVKSVTLDSTKKIATVEMYSPFTEEATYVIKTTDMKDQKFVAVTSNVADVVSMKLTWSQVEVNDARTLGVDILNKDGVNIADTELKGRVTFESSNKNGAFLNTSNNELTMFNIGDTTTITATFHTYDYDVTTGTEKGAITATQVVTCVKELQAAAGNITSYTIDASADWNNVKKSLSLSDSGKQLFVKGLYDVNDDNDLDDDGDKVDNTGATEASSDWEFASANTNVLNISSKTGMLYPAATGTATVIVKYKGTELGNVAITISPKREVTTLSIDATQFDLSTDLDVLDSKTVNVAVKDQLGDKLPGAAYDLVVERSNALPTGSNTNEVFNASIDTLNADGKTTDITFNATNGVLGSTAATTAAAVGTHAYKVKVTDTNTNKVIYGYVQINVKDASSNTDVSYWKVEADKAKYDTKVSYTSATDNDLTENVTLSVFGYASNGVKNERVTLGSSTAGKHIVVTQPNGSTVNITPGAVTGTFSLVNPGTGSDTGFLVKRDKGTYVLTYKDGTTAKATNYFTVEDTQVAPVLGVNSLYTAQAINAGADNIVQDAEAKAALMDCFNVTIDGVNVDSTICDVKVTGYGKSWYVTEFYVVTEMGANDLKQKVVVGKPITTEQN